MHMSALAAGCDDFRLDSLWPESTSAELRPPDQAVEENRIRNSSRTMSMIRSSESGFVHATFARAASALVSARLSSMTCLLSLSSLKVNFTEDDASFPSDRMK